MPKKTYLTARLFQSRMLFAVQRRNLIEVCVHNRCAVQIHLYVSAVSNNFLIIPLADGLEVSLLGSHNAVKCNNRG